MLRGVGTHWSHLEQREGDHEVLRGWDSLVASRTKRRRPGGVERGWDSLVALRTKRRRPGGVERGWDSLVASRTKNNQNTLRGVRSNCLYIKQRWEALRGVR